MINEGITANALTSVVPTYSATGGGPPGLDRIASDAVDQPGVSEIVLFLGTNDLYFGATAQQLIAGYRQAISEVHAAGLRIVAVTLLPREAGPEFRWTQVQQSYLEQTDNLDPDLRSIRRGTGSCEGGICRLWRHVRAVQALLTVRFRRSPSSKLGGTDGHGRRGGSCSAGASTAETGATAGARHPHAALLFATKLSWHRRRR